MNIGFTDYEIDMLENRLPLFATKKYLEAIGNKQQLNFANHPDIVIMKEKKKADEQRKKSEIINQPVEDWEFGTYTQEEMKSKIKQLKNKEKNRKRKMKRKLKKIKDI